MRRRTWTAALAALACVVLALPATAAAAGGPWLPCGDGSGTVILKVRPARCDNGGFQTSNANLWILKRLRWSKWGERKATGRGLSYPATGYPGYAGRPVRVTAFRLSYGCGAQRPYYTRLRFEMPAWDMRSRPWSGGPWTTTRRPPADYVVKAYRPDNCITDPPHRPDPGSVRCGHITFVPQSDYASEVWVKGVSCAEGRQLAWDYYDRRYGVIDGYDCVDRIRDFGDRTNAMAHVDTRCVRRDSDGSAVVTLYRS